MSDDGEMFDPPNARNSDPATSHEAAADAAMGASRGRLLVLECLFERPMTDYELAAATGWQQNSIGKRRHECMSAGLVARAKDECGGDMRRPAPSGSSSLVWAITDAGRKYFGGPDNAVHAETAPPIRGGGAQSSHCEV
jgi:hypothetical protein